MRSCNIDFFTYVVLQNIYLKIFFIVELIPVGKCLGLVETIAE